MYVFDEYMQFEFLFIPSQVMFHIGKENKVNYTKCKEWLYNILKLHRLTFLKPVIKWYSIKDSFCLWCGHMYLPLGCYSSPEIVGVVTIETTTATTTKKKIFLNYNSCKLKLLAPCVCGRMKAEWKFSISMRHENILHILHR